jgi:hypothetical protein
MTIKFEVGRTYSTRSICDHNCIFSFKILSRTAKTVTAVQPRSGTVVEKPIKRGLSVSSWNDAEQFKPFGAYSMAAVIHASDPDLSAERHPAFAAG